MVIFLTISFHNGESSGLESALHRLMARHPRSIGLNLYRLTTGFGYEIDIRGPLVYLNDLGNWGGFAAPVLLAIVIWIGDFLVVRPFLSGT